MHPRAQPIAPLRFQGLQIAKLDDTLSAGDHQKVVLRTEPHARDILRELDRLADPAECPGVAELEAIAGRGGETVTVGVKPELADGQGERDQRGQRPAVTNIEDMQASVDRRQSDPTRRYRCRCQCRARLHDEQAHPTGLGKPDLPGTRRLAGREVPASNPSGGVADQDPVAVRLRPRSRSRQNRQGAGHRLRKSRAQAHLRRQRPDLNELFHRLASRPVLGEHRGPAVAAQGQGRHRSDGADPHRRRTVGKAQPEGRSAMGPPDHQTIGRRGERHRLDRAQKLELAEPPAVRGIPADALSPTPGRFLTEPSRDHGETGADLQVAERETGVQDADRAEVVLDVEELNLAVGGADRQELAGGIEPGGDHVGLEAEWGVDELTRCGGPEPHGPASVRRQEKLAVDADDHGNHRSAPMKDGAGARARRATRSGRSRPHCRLRAIGPPDSPRARRPGPSRARRARADSPGPGRSARPRAARSYLAPRIRRADRPD